MRLHTGASSLAHLTRVRPLSNRIARYARCQPTTVGFKVEMSELARRKNESKLSRSSHVWPSPHDREQPASPEHGWPGVCVYAGFCQRQYSIPAIRHRLEGLEQTKGHLVGSSRTKPLHRQTIDAVRRASEETDLEILVTGASVAGSTPAPGIKKPVLCS